MCPRGSLTSDSCRWCIALRDGDGESFTGSKGISAGLGMSGDRGGGVPGGKGVSTVSGWGSSGDNGGGVPGGNEASTVNDLGMRGDKGGVPTGWGMSNACLGIKGERGGVPTG